MAFESLSERLNKAFKNISGQGKLTEKNMNDMLKEVRMSLLEADVNYDVVKSFVCINGFLKKTFITILTFIIVIW